MTVALSIFAGMYLFFIIERCMKIFMDAKARREGQDIVKHNHNNLVEVGDNEKLIKMVRNEEKKVIIKIKVPQ